MLNLYTRKRDLFNLFLFLGLWAFWTAALATEANYTVTWYKKDPHSDSRQLSTKAGHTHKLDIELCLKDKNSENLMLYNFDRELSQALISAHQKDIDSKTHQNRIKFNPNISNCVQYSVSLKQRNRSKYVIETDSLVLPTAIWFWSHEDLKQATFRFQDSKGKPLQFHLPWPQKTQFWQLETTPLSWTSRTLIGDVTVNNIALGNKRSINAILVGSLNKQSGRWIDWLKETANAIETGFGFFPIDKANILVVPAKSRRSPVPWGEVQRGGYPSVHFFIDSNKSQKKFREDWTASHEMSHLFVPKTSWRDRWLSEGIASYYQNVLRSRAGIITEQQAWQKLKQGFARGRRDFNNRSLRNVNQTMHLYWGGVSIYFLADLRLRETGTSLEETLKAFNQCCFDLDKTWRAEQLMSKFDQLSNTTIFSDLLNNEAEIRRFPINKSFEQNNNPLLKRHLSAILSGT